jgi:transglutaminase-like putative cysteine protease
VHLRIVHVTRYRYEEPAWDSFNELRLRPADDFRQTLHAFELSVRPRAELRSHRDRHDTLVHHFHLPHEHRVLHVMASALVETYPVPYPLEVGAQALNGLRHRWFEFLAPTARVPLDRDWHALLDLRRLSPRGDVFAHVEGLTAALQARFIYSPEATTVDTPLTAFVASGSGVCQDYAHAMLALCRADGIPARYVSGYVHAHPSAELDLVGSEGSHAWVETFLPGNGWVGFDPTNGCRVGEAHVKIGVGRDYDDVPPVRGLRRGGGDGQLEVEVRVRHAAPRGDADEAGALAWTTADER